MSPATNCAIHQRQGRKIVNDANEIIFNYHLWLTGHYRSIIIDLQHAMIRSVSTSIFKWGVIGLVLPTILRKNIGRPKRQKFQPYFFNQTQLFLTAPVRKQTTFCGFQFIFSNDDLYFKYQRHKLSGLRLGWNSY